MYRILLVDHEPASLWALSNFLRLSGYEVWQASDAEQALAVCDYAPPQFIVADWESPSGTGTDLCRRVRTRALAGYVYFILRTATHDPNELIDALQAGVDDFVAQAIVHGELLARLRAGARLLEYEKRLAALATADPLTGVGTAAAFRTALSAAIGGAARRHGRACIYADADYFGRINYLHGHPMGDAAIHALADRLTSSAGAGEVFRLEGNRFAVLLADADEARAVEWAERVRAELERQPLAVAGQSIALRLSFGVAAVNAETTVEAAMAQTEQALGVAKQSGRNCVVSASGVQAIVADRAHAATAADPLRSAVARDVMTSLTVSFSHEQLASVADEFLRDCQTDALSVVDADGKFLGTVTAAQLRSEAARKGDWTLAGGPRNNELRQNPRGPVPFSDSLSHDDGDRPATLGELLVGEAAVYEEETTVQTLYEFFQRSDAERVEIVHAGRPTGFVTRGSLAALGERLTPDHFAASCPVAQSSEYLLVADLG